MIRLLVPTALLVAATLLLYGWYERRYSAPTPADAARDAAAPAVQWDDTWLRERIGPLAPPPTPARLRVRLNDWGPPTVVTGWETLESGGTATVRLELERWLRLDLPEVLAADRLAIEATDAGHTLALEVHGPAAGVLPLFEHLLAMPLSRGYFTDPLRVHVEHDADHGVAGELVMRVLPGEEFVAR